MTQDLNQYISLLNQFLANTVSARDFKTLYLRIFLDDDTDFEENVFLSLDQLFAETNSFTQDNHLLQTYPGEYINEEQLRAAAAKTLAELQAIKE